MGLRGLEARGGDGAFDYFPIWQHSDGWVPHAGPEPENRARAVITCHLALVVSVSSAIHCGSWTD